MLNQVKYINYCVLSLLSLFVFLLSFVCMIHIGLILWMLPCTINWYQSLVLNLLVIDCNDREDDKL